MPGDAPPAVAPPPIRVVGARAAPLRDFYHAYLRWPWWSALGLIVTGYLLLNAGFATAYFALGGVEHAHAGSFLDAFYFSVQTMGTIGYGAMYPTTTAANLLVVSESVTGLVVTAVATGLVFTKFTQVRARVAFSRRAAIAPMDGVPTLAIRVGNERGNAIMDTRIRVTLTRTERTREGVTFYRLYDLPLTRDHAPALARTWTVMHPIASGSPLHAQTPQSVAKSEVELLVSISGVDDTTLQPVHAMKTYLDRDIVWGARHADVLSEGADGSLTLDVRKFDELTPTAPTGDFPYP